MTCPICDQKTINCDCTETERRQHAEIEELRLTDEEREAVKLAADFLEDEFYGCSDKCAAEHNAVATLRNLLQRMQ